MAEPDDIMAIISTGLLQQDLPLAAPQWSGAERAAFFVSHGLLGTGGLSPPPAYSGVGLHKFGTKLTED